MTRPSMLRCLINWCADSTTMPKWLRSRIAGDRTLREYEDELTSMLGRLRDDAETWAESSEASVTQRERAQDRAASDRNRLTGSKQKQRVSLAISACVAAVVVGFVGVTQFRRSPHPERIAPVATGNLDGVRDEIRALAMVIGRSAQNIEGSAKNLPESVGLVAFNADARAVRNAARTSLKVASRRYGQALALLGQAVQDQSVSNPDPKSP